MVIPTMKVDASEVSQDNSSEISGYLDVKDSEISEVMTYDEMVTTMAKNENITIDEAIKILGPEEVRPYEKVVNEISKNTNLSYEDASKLINPNLIKETRSGKVVRATYRNITRTITVSNIYKPKLVWYCETDESGQFRAIRKIKNTSMNRSYNGTSKQFSGKVYTNLEDPNRIYYEVNGDFYNNGTTTVSGGTEISVGKSGTANFSVSYSSNHFKYHYSTGRQSF